MKKRRLVFIGSSSFGFKCFERMLKGVDYEVVGVVTAPQIFNISYSKTAVKNYLHSDFAGYCKKQGIPCALVENGMKEECLLEQVRTWQPDLFFVVGWYYLLPESWMKLAPAYGMHASLLPEYSGGAPLVWSIIEGETVTGITLFRFSQGVDNGDVVAQKRTEILYVDTIDSLYTRIEQLGIELIEENISALVNGTALLTMQDESKRTLFPQRSPADGRVEWQQSTRKIYDFVRAQTRPYPGAFTEYSGQIIRIWTVEEMRPAAGWAAAGTLNRDAEGQLYVSCIDGILKLVDWQLEDMSGNVLENKQLNCLE